MPQIPAGLQEVTMGSTQRAQAQVALMFTKNRWQAAIIKGNDAPHPKAGMEKHKPSEKLSYFPFT